MQTALSAQLTLFVAAFASLGGSALGGQTSDVKEIVASTVVLGSDEHTSFLEDWFETVGFSSEVRKLLIEQDQRIERLLRTHREGLSKVRRGLHADPERRIVARDQLLDDLIERLDELRADYQKKGDEKSFKLRDLIAGLRRGDAPPLPLNTTYEEGDAGRSGVDTVSYNGHEYALVAGKAWRDAQDLCEELGGYLACVETQEELEFLGSELLASKGLHGGSRLDHLHTTNIFWVGATDALEEGSWRWVSGAKVNDDLFFRDVEKYPQPTNFHWGEHHAGFVRHQTPDIASGEMRYGLVSWVGTTGCRNAICEWGRTPLPEAWAFLTEREEERIFAPYWRDLARQESLEDAASEKVKKKLRSALNKEAKLFSGGVEDRREALLQIFQDSRKRAIKDGVEAESVALTRLIDAVGAGIFDAEALLLPRDGLERLPHVVARAFGKTYVYVTEEIPLGDAEAYCARLGGHLPHLAHEVEFSLIEKVLERVGGKQSTWISGQFSGEWRAGRLDEAQWPSSKFPEPYDGEDMKVPGLDLKAGDVSFGRPYLENRRPFLCVIEGYVAPVQWTELQVEGVDAGLRGLSVVDAETAWCGGGDGTLLRTTDGGVTWEPRPVPGGEDLDFRSISAHDADTVWVASAGEGELSRIYHTEDGGLNWTLQHTNKEPLGFYDSIAFWDKQRGLVLGDQVGGRLTILRTEDGGANWTRVSAGEQPLSPEGECAFAASGTSIALASKRYAWIGTGGTTSRVFTSVNAGKAWEVSFPLHVGDEEVESSGIFSLSTLDGRRGLAVGGDYKEPGRATTHFARTEDGGRTWRSPSVAANASPAGFRSCVAADPSAEQRAWIAVGTEGADVSLDGGLTWRAAGEVSLNSVGFAPKGGVGFAVGPDGVIMRFELVE